MALHHQFRELEFVNRKSIPGMVFMIFHPPKIENLCFSLFSVGFDVFLSDIPFKIEVDFKLEILNIDFYDNVNIGLA